MLYDFDYCLYRPIFYSRPRYSSYLHDYYVGDNYLPSYRYYTPYYRSPSVYSSAYFPYSRNHSYLYSIPNYSHRPIYTSIPPSKMVSPPNYPEADMYSFTYGTNFNSLKEDVRSAKAKMEEIKRPRASSVPRFIRKPTSTSVYDSDIDYYRFKRATSTSPLIVALNSSHY